MNRQIGQRVEQALASFRDIEVVDVRCTGRGGKGTVQVFLDKAGGISLDDLTAINHFLSKEMDTWDMGTGPYMLEVSSAGLERPLTKREHFERFVQRKVKLELHQAVAEKRRKYTGIIHDVQGEMIFIQTETGLVEISHDQIRKANLVYEP